MGKMSFVRPRPDVPGYADKLVGDDRDVLKLRPGITGPATLKYRVEDEMIAEYVAARQADGDSRAMQDIAVEYNDKVIYPNKVRLNCYYYRHYSFITDIQMIFCTVLGKKMKYAGRRFEKDGGGLLMRVYLDNNVLVIVEDNFYCLEVCSQ